MRVPVPAAINVSRGAGWYVCDETPGCRCELLCGRVRWQDNLGNGVCGLAFDRPTVPMNKFLATTLEAQWHAFDARTLHKKSGGPVYIS